MWYYYDMIESLNELHVLTSFDPMHVLLLEREIFQVIQESNISVNNITSNQDEVIR